MDDKYERNKLFFETYDYVVWLEHLNENQKSKIWHNQQQKENKSYKENKKNDIWYTKKKKK